MDRKRVTGLAALLLTVGTFFLLLLPSSFCISAAPPSLWMESAESVHPGDIVSVELWLTGEGLEAVEGALWYDAAFLKLIDITASQELAEWRLEVGPDNSFLLFDSSGKAPAGGRVRLLTVRFLVRHEATAGTAAVGFTGGLAQGEEKYALPEAFHRMEILAPPPNEPELGLLEAEGVIFTPAFDPETTAYAASVSAEVEKLTIRAEAANKRNTVKIVENPLKEGAVTNQYVTVTTPEGRKRIYTIQVFREKKEKTTQSRTTAGSATRPPTKSTAQGTEPSASKEGSGINDLIELVVEGYDMRPAFRRDITAYRVSLPYEAFGDIRVLARASHPGATVEVVDAAMPAPGESWTVSVICTAENGRTKLYTITLSRASGPSDAPSAGTAPGTVKRTEGTAALPPSDGGRGPVWALMLLAVCAGAGGVLATVFFHRRGAARGEKDQDSGGGSGDS